MLQLTNPLWLWATAAIIVPVLIHLWHIKTGKTLKIGSIALLGESARQSSRSFRITDWLLMLLRCLLLILLAVLLTVPLWQKPAEKFNLKGWILVENAPVKTVYQKFKPTIDSLAKAGYELHRFNASFSKIKPEELSKDSIQKEPESYWPLLKLLEQKIPAKTAVYLFTGNQLRYFKGARPNLDLNLNWQTFTPADSVSTWIQNAFLTATDSIRVVLGSSKPGGTSFNAVNLQSGDRGNSRFQLSFEGGKPTISLKNEPQKVVPVDTSTLKITVFQNQFATDANYLMAALQTVKKFSGRKMKLLYTDNQRNIPAKQDWIFWLSNQKIPQNDLKLNLGGSVFQYETGKVQPISSWINADEKFTGNGAEQINLYQHFLPGKNSISNIKTVWQDGFGAPVLSLQETGKTNTYRFYSRFDPAWNELVWSSNFPQIMLNLIYKSYPQPDFLAKDKRIITPAQLKPGENEDTEPGYHPAKTAETTDLTHVCWIGLFLMFLLERIISAQTKKQEIYG